MTVISFTDRGKHKVVAYANDQNAIEWVESSYGHPVVGDIKVVTYYGPYRDFAGVKFPTKIIQYQDGKPTLDLTVTAVRANPPVDIEVPANVRSDPVPVKSEKAADGVWYITGGSASQRADRNERLFDRRRSAAWRTTFAGGDGRSEKAGAEQADQVSGQYAPSLRPLFAACARTRPRASRSSPMKSTGRIMNARRLNSWNFEPGSSWRSRRRSRCFRPWATTWS